MATITKDAQENIKISLVRSAVHNLAIQAYERDRPREALRTIADRMSGELQNPDAAEIASIIRDYPEREKLEKKLSEHLNRVSARAIDNPFYLRELLSMDIRHDQIPIELDGPIGEEVRRWSNGEKDAFTGLFFLYHMALGKCMFEASQTHTPEGYILGVKEDGSIIQKRTNEGRPIEVYNEWLNISRHSMMFLGNFGRMLRGNTEDHLNLIVNDQEKWIGKNSYADLPEMPEGAEVGERLLRFGLEHKVYAPDCPYRIMFNDDKLDSISIDTSNTGEVAIFKIKNNERRIAVGCIMALPDNQLGLLTSDSSFFYRTLFGFDAGNRQRFLAALIGSAMRDMYVCEEQARIYSPRKTSPPPTKANPNPVPTIVWLARRKINYHNPNQIRNSETNEEYSCLDRLLQEVSPAHIPGHLRICQNPNPRQIELARRYGIVVPEGRTFVKPHNRNNYERGAPRYKSRSALQVLFGASPNLDSH